MSGKTVIGSQFYLMKRLLLQQEGADQSQRHLKSRDKYFPYVRRSRFRWERRAEPDRGVIRWSLWITSKNSGKRVRGVNLVIPLGKICAEGWSAIAQEIRNAKKEVRHGN